LCDTEYSGGGDYSIKNAVKAVNAVEGGIQSLVVITGGEPFRQMGLRGLVLALNEGYPDTIDIETNGTLPVDSVGRLVRLLTSVNIICSPKRGAVDPTLFRHASAWKILISADSEGAPKLDGCLGGQVVLDEGRRAIKKTAFSESLFREIRIGAIDERYQVFVHPEDHDVRGHKLDAKCNKMNQLAAVAFVRAYPMFRLGCQLHKLYNLE
jgi:organic radical activating enzyme